MTDQHPITPSSEFAAQLRREAPVCRDGGVGRELWLIDKAAQWGADQELEACCEWLHEELKLTLLTLDVGLRAARRPKPPSLKEQALEALETIEQTWAMPNADFVVIIRRALEQLSDD